MDLVITAIEARVLGCLMEKEVATPEYYPLTLNALVAACNQKSNRDPVMSLNDETVVRALDELRCTHHLARQVTTTGNRVPKYQHDVRSKWEFPPQEMAILCELFVRGPQTVGELRTHASRLCEFPDTQQVAATLQRLVEWGGGPLVTELPREAGSREPRWAHLFCGPIEVHPVTPEAIAEPARLRVYAENERIAALEKQVADLRQAIDALRTELVDFRKQFG